MNLQFLQSPLKFFRGYFSAVFNGLIAVPLMEVIRSLSTLQKGSDKAFIPIHVQVGPRTRSRVTIWSLPEELLLLLLKDLHIRDILSMRSVHPYLRDLIDNSYVLNSASFQNSWPSPLNIRHFENAAECGNIEAFIKLALAHLYNEGCRLPSEDEQKQIAQNGQKAAAFFCQVEKLCGSTSPFSWLFIRPPWSLSGACCKACVFNHLKQYLREFDDPKIQVCVVKTMQLLDDEKMQQEASKLLQQAASKGMAIAAYMLWEQKYSNVVSDRATELQSIRELRDIAGAGCLDAQLALCKAYASGKLGGITKGQAEAFIREMVQSSKPITVDKVFKLNQELTPSMRYILVDWLVEVAGMKDFSSQTLHVAINLVDRYLRCHQTTKSRLQLLGVSAMVVCSRYLGKDIITIREAAWLTDNTYKYEDVVKMMGEIVATLKGNIRMATSLDFVNIFSHLVFVDIRTCCLMEYICELSLLHSELGSYSPAETAASAVLLSRAIQKMVPLWPVNMEEFTGFLIEDLKECVFHQHRKCFLEGSVVDHRDVTLKAIKERYTEEEFYRVSEIKIPSHGELCCLMGVSEWQVRDSHCRRKFRNMKNLIMSPSRKVSLSERPVEKQFEREKTATPTRETSLILNESVMSGYEGDKEDEDDSMMECGDAVDESARFLMPVSPSKHIFGCESKGSVTWKLHSIHGNSLYFFTTNSRDSLSQDSDSGKVCDKVSETMDISDWNGDACEMSETKLSIFHSSDSDGESSMINHDMWSKQAIRTRSHLQSDCVTSKNLKRKCKIQIGNASKTFTL